VTSRTQEDFWRSFDELPASVQQQARERFRLWQRDAFNAALHFKPLHGDVWSVRVSQHHRALGRRKGSLVVWFWVGSHADYDEMIKRLR
jgi:Txe/YoeB family toxin of Txe-Axe toxin-antitoxin module